MGLEVVRWQGHDYQGLPDGRLWILSREPIPSLRLESLDRFLNRGNTVIGPLAAVSPLLEREGVRGIEANFGPRSPRPGAQRAESSSPDDAHWLSGGPEPDAVFARTRARGQGLSGDCPLARGQGNNRGAGSRRHRSQRPDRRGRERSLLAASGPARQHVSEEAASSARRASHRRSSTRSRLALRPRLWANSLLACPIASGWPRPG